jgi:hypothetical protein
MLELDALPGLHDMVRNTWFEPASDGFPEGLLDQPFYGWVRATNLKSHPVSNGLYQEGR